MLQKLEFTLEHAYISCADGAEGSLNIQYGYENHPKDIIVKTDSTHPFWEKYNIGKGDMRIFHVRPIEDGIYETNGFNFGHDLSRFTNYKESKGEFGKSGQPVMIDYKQPIEEVMKNYRKVKNPYGVADNIEQIKNHFKQAIKHKTNKIIISVVEIAKDTQPKNWGWRWHKWGEYIGIQNPQMEYIADEPEIERVYCFHAYAVIKK